MIKKIQQDSGARIQFRPEDEQGGPNRMCNLTGTHEQTQAAANMIQELIDSTAQRQGMLGSGGQGQGWPRPAGVRLDGIFDGRSRFGNGCDPNEMTYSVPAEKCGLVIGKGGDTIREICRQSGAHVELNRDQNVNMNSLERIFRITGSPEQMQAAVRLISEKAGIAFPRDISAPGAAPLQSAIANVANLYGQTEITHQPQQQLQQLVTPNYAAIPGWGATSQYQPYTQPNIVDPSKQAVDAAWSAYYAAQLPTQAPAPAVQQYSYQPAALTQPTLQSIANQQTSPYISRAAVTPQPSLNPSTGQLDYSAAWAEYYRQQGMPQHAQAILQAAQHITQHPQ